MSKSVRIPTFNGEIILTQLAEIQYRCTDKCSVKNILKEINKICPINYNGYYKSKSEGCVCTGNDAIHNMYQDNLSELIPITEREFNLLVNGCIPAENDVQDYLVETLKNVSNDGCIQELEICKIVKTLSEEELRGWVSFSVLKYIMIITSQSIDKEEITNYTLEQSICNWLTEQASMLGIRLYKQEEKK